MPITIPEGLPARTVLERENIFVMDEKRAMHQDIRPLRILLLNLMPDKPTTETQICRCLSNTPLQINITLLQTSSHISKNTPQEHLIAFYQTFDQICHERYDGMIITGAPVEHLPFEQVDYWEELCEIMDWSKANVHSVFHICWSAQAALYHHYGIDKAPLPEKLSGVFSHRVLTPHLPLVRGFDENFLAPHSRHTGLDTKEIAARPEMTLVSDSQEAGPYILLAREGRQIFVTGHSEYDIGTLAAEYRRDIARGLPVGIPKNYFPNDDPSLPPNGNWRAHGHLLYTNWLNYYVYQSTPYDLSQL
ncbi:MAG TPA: homoserine O-succinyltransferase [Clostridiales bacterium]|nr:homoserine O-succinyltransferase [Clostridiales bacterium]